MTSRTSLLLVFFLRLFVLGQTNASAISLTRGPYLQLLTTHSVTVVWKTDEEASCGLSVAAVGETPLVLTEPGVATVCAVAVEGLVPGQAYSYAAYANDVPLHEPAVFHADHPTARFRAGILGDSGSASAEQLAVRDRLLEGELDLLVHTGDMVYPHGAAVNQNATFFDPYRDLIRRMVFWPVLGNHDVETDHGDPWRDVFYTPANNPDHREDYYSFDRGNAHFVVLDSNGDTMPGSDQYEFLDQDLATTMATWKFVVFHHTIYTSGGNSDVTTRTNLVPLFDRYHVDLVFMGHVHNYARTKPLRDGRMVAPGTGTVYVTTGGGGDTLAPTSLATSMDFAESAFHYTRLTVDGPTLLLEMIRADGEVRDAMALVKPSTTTTTIKTSVTTTTTTTLPGPMTTVEVRISARADDAEERARGQITLGSGDLELVHDRHDQTVGLRFAAVDVPAGAAILDAWVQFKADEAQTRSTSLLIRGQATANALPFTATRGNISTRPRTGSGTAWPAVPAWPAVSEVSARQRTPDLAPVIQEIVSRAGWVRGNALVLFVTGKGHRTARAFDADPTGAPLLHVEYRMGMAPSGAPTDDPEDEGLCAQGLTVRPCVDQHLPATVGRRVARACLLIGRATRVGAHQSHILMTRAARQLGRAVEVVTRTTRRGGLSAECAGALSSRIDDLRLATQRSVRGERE